MRIRNQSMLRILAPGNREHKLSHSNPISTEVRTGHSPPFADVKSALYCRCRASGAIPRSSPPGVPKKLPLPSGPIQGAPASCRSPKYSSGKGGACEVRLPEGLDSAELQPVDLRGTARGAPVLGRGGRLAARLDAFSPSSFRLAPKP
jgi:hypothetical protein